MSKPTEKKILLSVPEELLEKVDAAAQGDGLTRSAFIRECLKHVLALKHRLEIEESLIKGYQQMAEINLELARFGAERDEETFAAYEANLERSPSESET